MYDLNDRVARTTLWFGIAYAITLGWVYADYRKKMRQK